MVERPRNGVGAAATRPPRRLLVKVLARSWSSPAGRFVAALTAMLAVAALSVVVAATGSTVVRRRVMADVRRLFGYGASG